jgi:hypothetical protein
VNASAPAPTGTSALDDRPAIERLRRDDRTAVTELYRRHAGAVYWNAWGVLRSRPDAEEMTADAFLTLWTPAARDRDLRQLGSSLARRHGQEPEPQQASRQPTATNRRAR